MRTALEKINRKICPSGKNKFVGRDVLVYTATPNGALTGRVGSLCWDKTNSNAYICTAVPNTWIILHA